MIDGTAPGGPALPPAPWTNVLANPGFGCLVTEAGLGYSWAGNSQMNRLTPWSNDPVSDPPGEAVYLRDEETGAVWTPTPLPRGAGAAVIVRHGQGYTRYSRQSHGLEQELLVLVPPDDPVKLVCLSVRNTGDRPRRLSATFYAEWVLGTCSGQRPLASRVRARRGIRRRARPQRLGGRLRRLGSRSRPSARGRTPPPPTAPSSWAATARRPRPPPSDVLDLSAAPGRRSTRAPRSMTPIVLAPGQTEEVVFVLGQADTSGTSPASHGYLHRPRPGPGGTRGGPASVGPDPGCRPGEDTRCWPGPDGQPLAALPGPGLPGLGPVGVLPVGRSVRLSRSAPGRHGPGL